MDDLIDTAALESLALKLVAARSYSNQEADVASVVADELHRRGFDVEIDRIGNVVGTKRFGDGPIVLLDSHLDTVPVVDAARWTTNPEGEIRNGRMYGRGIVDMKGALAATIHGVCAIGPAGKGTVVISGTVAEELVEGAALTAVVEAYRPDYVIIGEPSNGRVVRGQRGRAELIVDVQGVSCHSAYPDAGVNAAEVMADIITTLRALDPPSDGFLGDGTLVLTDIRSDPYPSLSVVPERCVATFDRRTLPGEDSDDVVRPIRDIVADVATRWGATATVCIAIDDFDSYAGTPINAPNFAPAWILEPDAPIVSAAVQALLSVGLDATTDAYRFCTNGSATAGQLGIPTIGFGPGEPDQAHTVDESMDLGDLHRSARGYAAIVAALLRCESPKT